MIAGYTSVLSCPRTLNVPEGRSWVMKTTVRSSAGSTQKIVDAAPPHMYSPERGLLPVAAALWVVGQDEFLLGPTATPG